MNRHTYNHRSGGWITVDSGGGRLLIQAYTSAGFRLGDHYRTIPGARVALTREHRAWRAKADAEHHAAVQSIVGGR